MSNTHALHEKLKPRLGAGGRLHLGRCGECDRVIQHGRGICPECRSRRFQAWLRKQRNPERPR